MELGNCEAIETAAIDTCSCSDFYSKMIELTEDPANHCVAYFARPEKEGYSLTAFIAKDRKGTIEALSAMVGKDEKLLSLTAERPAFHVFEREMNEQFGIDFAGHPWLKPLRYSHDRADKSSIYDYPFFKIDSEEFHKVGVGPIHAGIIEPGHFRFICEGEKIHHLEIQLGWQHRGVETLMLAKPKLLQKAILAESIAGDSVVAHAVAFAQAYEAVCGFTPSEALQSDRTIALEQERIAIHTGDLGAICTDIAYQLGNAVFGRLRTPMINYFQKWCGSRFAKGLIRPFGSHFPFTDALAQEWLATAEKYEPDFREMANLMFDLPSVLSRIERTGVVSTETAQSIGLVGMAAKASGMARDVRATHPTMRYKELALTPVVKNSGDVYARARVRYEEVLQSLTNIRTLLAKRPAIQDTPTETPALRPSMTTIALTEGWRGMVCHVLQTDAEGKLATFKAYDPSVHNWLGLALAVRGNGISDFPICNKSFDLSYCGHDL